MKNKEEIKIKIKIDPNGNVYRETVDRSQGEEKKSSFLGKLVPSRST